MLTFHPLSNSEVIISLELITSLNSKSMLISSFKVALTHLPEMQAKILPQATKVMLQ